MQSVAARLGREGIPYVMKEKTRNIYEHFITRFTIAVCRIIIVFHGVIIFQCLQ